jgi:hypothetical protein
MSFRRLRLESGHPDGERSRLPEAESRVLGGHPLAGGAEKARHEPAQRVCRGAPSGDDPGARLRMRTGQARGWRYSRSLREQVFSTKPEPTTYTHGGHAAAVDGLSKGRRRHAEQLCSCVHVEQVVAFTGRPETSQFCSQGVDFAAKFLQDSGELGELGKASEEVGRGNGGLTDNLESCNLGASARARIFRTGGT